MICPVLEPPEKGGGEWAGLECCKGVRQMRFEGLLERHERGELSQGEAAEMLGVSERTFRRWRDRLRNEGRRACAIGGSASRRAGGRRSRRSCACWDFTRSAMRVSR